MEKNRRLILDVVLAHWHKDFTGISALNIASQLSLQHDRVFAILDILEKEGFGNLRRDVNMYQTNVQDPNSDAEKEIRTVIFFPSQELLSKDFLARKLYEQNIPEYKKRLHKGGSQLSHFYFDYEVLRRYLDHPELYDVTNTVVSGHIRNSNTYLSTLSHEEIERFELIHFRFGKRKLENGKVAISAILHDLSELPKEHQKYWETYEIEELSFSLDDPNFETYFRMNFGAEWLEINDPLVNLANQLERINGLFVPDKLFKFESNPYLNYPVLNTKKNFADCCSELYKLVGPDNLVEKSLVKTLTIRYGYSKSKLKHAQSGKRWGKLKLLGEICLLLGVGGLVGVIEEIKSHRIEADHMVTSPQSSETNYSDKFNDLVQRLVNSLREFENLIDNRRPTIGETP